MVLEMPFCSSPRQRGSTGSTPRSVDGRCRQAGVFWWRAVMVGWLTGRVWWTGWTGVAADRGAARDLVQGSFEPGQHHGQSVTHLSGLCQAGRSHW